MTINHQIAYLSSSMYKCHHSYHINMSSTTFLNHHHLLYSPNHQQPRLEYHHCVGSWRSAYLAVTEPNFRPAAFFVRPIWWHKTCRSHNMDHVARATVQYLWVSLPDPPGKMAKLSHCISESAFRIPLGRWLSWVTVPLSQLVGSPWEDGYVESLYLWVSFPDPPGKMAKLSHCTSESACRIPLGRWLSCFTVSLSQLAGSPWEDG